MNNTLDYFLNPQSVAVVGATSRTGPGSYNSVEVMLEKGYRGKIYPVNPRAQEIMGLKTYPSILDIPHQVDLAVITTGRNAVPQLVRQCVAKPVRGIIIITQGFADADEKGRAMQSEIKDIISGTGIRVVGPNTLGVINNFDGFITAFLSVPIKFSGVGLICQSGMFINGHSDIYNGIGYGIDIGNSSDIGFNEVLDFYSRENRVEVINLHMEGISGGRRFIDMMRETTRQKPVIVYKTGRTEEGAHAAGSHSGSLAGEDHVYGAAFKQAGIIRAETFDELRDFNKAFMKYKTIPGNRAAVVTFTGGGGIALLDAMGSSGLVPAKLSPQTLQEIAEIFPDWLEVSNPIDLWPSVMAHGYDKVYPHIFRCIMDDPGVDMVICLGFSHAVPAEGDSFLEEYILEAARRRPDKPVALWNFGSARHQMVNFIEDRGPVAVFSSPERLARAMGALYQYYHHIRNMNNEPAIVSDRTMELGLSDKIKGALPGHEAMALIGKSGIPVVRGKLARNMEEALKAAVEIGYPVAMKVVSPQAVHKTEVGGVRLNILNSEELKEAYEGIIAGVVKKVPGALIEGILVEEFKTGGIELILGTKRDSQFGPVIVFGLGGIYTEIIKDTAFRIAPLSRSGALEMIKETKAYQILQGARGQGKANIDSLVSAIIALSQLVISNPEISEVDINPLLATPDGVLALDCRIIV